MVLLKHSFRKPFRTLPLGGVLLFTLSSLLSAEVVPFFNPMVQTTPYRTSFSMEGFIASDPVSLYDFFHDWQGKYSPRKGDNIALEAFRIDMGIVLDEGYYFGYFFQKDTLIQTNRGFSDAYYALKNDLFPNEETSYELYLLIEAIQRHGLTLSRSFRLFERGERHVDIAFGGYLSYDTQIQSGDVVGEGILFPDESYSLWGEVDYFYEENLLYGLNVENNYGIGYGFSFSSSYVDEASSFKARLIVNDLFARSYWKHLPYSLVSIETENESVGEDGYVSYDPTISGWELNEKYIHHFSPKYHLDIEKNLTQKSRLMVGYEYAYGLSMPYIKFLYEKEDDTYSLRYESRFKSLGFGYEGENLSFSLYSDGIKYASSFGFSLKYAYTF
jgi:hypothetical protein